MNASSVISSYSNAGLVHRYLLRSLNGKMVALQFSLLPEDKLYSYTLREAS